MRALICYMNLFANKANTIASEKLKITLSPRTFPFLLNIFIPSKYPYKNNRIEDDIATIIAAFCIRSKSTPPSSVIMNY